MAMTTDPRFLDRGAGVMSVEATDKGEAAVIPLFAEGTMKDKDSEPTLVSVTRPMLSPKDEKEAYDELARFGVDSPAVLKFDGAYPANSRRSPTGLRRPEGCTGATETWIVGRWVDIAAIEPRTPPSRDDGEKAYCVAPLIMPVGKVACEELGRGPDLGGAFRAAMGFLYAEKARSPS